MLVILNLILILPYARGKKLPKNRLGYTCGRGEIGKVTYGEKFRYTSEEISLNSEDEKVDVLIIGHDNIY